MITSSDTASPQWSLRDKAFTIVFALGWTAGTVFLDQHVCTVAVRQLMARRFPTTLGRITESRVESIGNRKVQYRVQIQFVYEIADSQYRGDCYSYGAADWSSDRSKIARIVQKFPVGANVEVYYNPRNLTDSLLAPGLTGSNLFELMFALPFNVAVLAVFLVLIPLAFDRGWRRLAGGAKVFDDGFVARVRLPQITPLGVGLVMGFVLPILIAVLVGFIAGNDPPLAIMLVAWSVVFLASILVPLCLWLRTLSGRWDLVVDRTAGTLRLPQSQGRNKVLVLPLAEVTGVKLDTLAYRSAKGAGYNYVPVVSFNASNGQHQEERVVIWLSKKAAQGLVSWLKQQIQTHPSATHGRHT